MATATVTATAAALVATLLVVVCTQLTTTSATPAITDLLSWGLDYVDGGEAKSPGSDSDDDDDDDRVRATRDCSCDGPACTCCVNFNISYVDLGGPGCVKLKYLSVTEGLMVNVSYGDSVLHSQQIKADKPEPACMEMLSGVAGVCARFTELAPEPDNSGLRGCAVLEPTLLGYAQAHYAVGCFRAGPDGMTVDPDREPVVTSEESEEEETEESEGEEETEGSTDKPEGSGEEQLISNLVSEATGQTINFLSSLMGLTFGSGGGSASSSASASGTPSSTPALEAAPAAPQRARSLNAIPV